MSLRWKIALAMAAISLAATTAVGLLGYRTTSGRLHNEVDRSIESASVQMFGTRTGDRFEVPTRGLLEVFSVRVLGPDGEVVATSFRDELVITTDAAALVGQSRAHDEATVESAGERMRVHTFGMPNGAVQIARPLDEVDSVLSDLRRRTIVLVVSVSVAAAALGWLIAGTVAAPLSRLTKAAEDVGSSGRLDVDVPGSGNDEVGRLGKAFREMLGALGRSRAEQQRLVQDAGHELRTPLTSLRTNLSVLRRHPDMDPEMRTGVLDDLDAEVGELTELVNELVAVASGELEVEPAETLELTSLASEVAERVGRRRSREILVLAPVDADVTVVAPPSALERAITNLVDNACKFDQSGAPVEVVVEAKTPAATLTVLDRGPGVPEGEHERVFARFHRADAARSMPGSGLGLSIVHAVVVRAGGSVVARARDGGGAAIGFTLPVAGADGASAAPDGTPLPPPQPPKS